MRTLDFFAGVLCSLAAAQAFEGRSSPADDVLRARRLEIVDGEGRVRIVLGEEIEQIPISLEGQEPDVEPMQWTSEEMGLFVLDESGAKRLVAGNLDRLSSGDYGLRLAGRNGHRAVDLAAQESRFGTDALLMLRAESGDVIEVSAGGAWSRIAVTADNPLDVDTGKYRRLPAPAGATGVEALLDRVERAGGL